jgi:hypothetical protein
VCAASSVLHVSSDAGATTRSNMLALSVQHHFHTQETVHCCAIASFILRMLVQPKDEWRREQDMYQFYLPLVNTSQDLSNIPLVDYFASHALEIAPVSDAAKDHIDKLQSLEVPPEHWRDFYSRPVLAVAVFKNYVALAQWLVEQGVPLKNDEHGRDLLKWVEKEEMNQMAKWMRAHMKIDPDDDLDDMDDTDDADDTDR